MKVPFPQIDLPRGISGGSDAWDDVQAGVLLLDDYFNLPLFGDFVDYFNDNNIDSAVWLDWGGAEVVNVNSQLEMTILSGGGNYQGMETKELYKLTDSSVFVEVKSAGNQALGSLEVTFSLFRDTSTKIFFLIAGNNLIAYKKIANSNVYITQTSYNSTTQKYLRLREESGVTYWEYSANATSWTTLHSEATPFPMGAMQLELVAGVYANEATSTLVIYDNINSLPGGGSFSQSCTETIVLNDSSFRTPSKRLIDALVLVDTVRKTPSRTLIDAFTLVDTVRRTTTRTLTDSIALVDTFAGKITARLLSEAISLVDTVSKTTSRTITEAISLVDTIIRTTTRRLTEVITLQDVFAGVKITTKALVETLVLVDTMAKFTSRTISETVILIDTMIRTTTRLFTEAIVVVDTVRKVAGKSLTEAIVLVDSIAKLTTRRLIEAIVVVDTVIRTSTRRFLEAITLIDTFAFSRIIARAFTEALSLTDSIAKTASKVARETITVVDSFLGEVIVLVIKSIGNWIAYSLTGLAKILRFGNKTHTLSTTKQSHVLLLSERSFTVSTTDITHTNRTNKTP